jgi:hypothetical protein
MKNIRTYILPAQLKVTFNINYQLGFRLHSIDFADQDEFDHLSFSGIYFDLSGL